ncbi:MAG TPA: winged helix-turn-helix domain-containing protein [Ideonella sp.]|nr:winged helix-turn-helix domain-containing protein [Ideonella sp.]
MNHNSLEGMPAWTPAAEQVVSDRAAVEILWHVEKRLHLKPFIGQSADLASAAAQLGISKPAMSYWIGRLMDAGLIRLVRIEKRGRHSISHYRCVADRLRVSLEEAPLSSYEGVLDDFTQRWQAQARTAMARSLAKQAPDLELCIANTGAAAGLFTTILPKPGRPAPPDDFIQYWARLWLTDAEANQLADELNALYDRYAALSDKTSKTVPTLMQLTQVRESQR